jgi:hypothetical protein
VSRNLQIAAPEARVLTLSLSHYRGPQNGLDILRPDDFSALEACAHKLLLVGPDFLVLSLLGVLFLSENASRSRQAYYCNIVTGVKATVVAKTVDYRPSVVQNRL